MELKNTFGHLFFFFRALSMQLSYLNYHANFSLSSKNESLYKWHHDIIHVIWEMGLLTAPARVSLHRRALFHHKETGERGIRARGGRWDVERAGMRHYLGQAIWQTLQPFTGSQSHPRAYYFIVVNRSICGGESARAMTQCNIAFLLLRNCQVEY